MSVATQGASSAPSLSVSYLDATGALVSKATALTANVSNTPGMQQVTGSITVPSGVSQLRVVLTGFSPTDLSTKGTVWVDDVWLS
jgi:hypothetical protein